MDISKIKIKGKIYNIVDANEYVAEANGIKYNSLKEAVAGCASTKSTIKMLKNEMLSEQVVIGDGQDITLNLNGKALTAKPNWNFTSGLIAIHHGGTLTVEGQGEIYGVSPGGCVFCGIVLSVNKNDIDDTKPIKLTVNGGHIVGQCYGISGQGSVNRGNTECIINDGIIESIGIIANEDNCGFYQPQIKCKTIINGGIIRGRTAIEVRSGDLTINGGIFEAYGYAADAMVKNQSGPTSKGAALAIAQHSTKQPINVVINDGIFMGEHPFYEGNPMGNDELSIASVQVDIQGGSFRPVGQVDEVFYSEDLTQFIHSGDFPTILVKKEYLDPDKYDVDNWVSLF